MILKDYINADWETILDERYVFDFNKEKHKMTLAELKIFYKQYSKESLQKYGPKVTPEIERLKFLFSNVSFKVTTKIMANIISYSKTRPNDFIFPILDNDKFRDVVFDDNVRLDKYQYGQIQSKEAMYNKDLKELQKVCGISTTITSHLQRHTYTNLLLEVTDNLYTISKSLGHTKLSTTEHYLKDFVADKVDGPNIDLIGAFIHI